jgi:hypothetical protein
VALGLPDWLPNGMPGISSDAVSVSDEAWTIVGNLYYDGPRVGGVRFPAYPCEWDLRSDGTYDTARVLDVLPRRTMPRSTTSRGTAWSRSAPARA